MYLRLPSTSQLQQQTTSRPTSSSSYRYPLASPKVTPPTISTHNSCATRRDSGCGDSAGARALLSRVASSPVSPKATGRLSSPTPSSTSERRQEEKDESERHPAMVGRLERRYSDGYEAARGWMGHKQRDGYISFPDYEKYFQSYEHVHEGPEISPTT